MPEPAYRRRSKTSCCSPSMTWVCPKIPLVFCLFYRCFHGATLEEDHRRASPDRHGTLYPKPLDAPCLERKRWKLEDAAGLTQFDVNLLQLSSGAWSAQRHRHITEDEFVYLLEGEVVLMTDFGEETLGPCDCAGFKAGQEDGHHFRNRSDREAVLLEVGTRDPKYDGAEYPNIDLKLPLNEKGYRHKDGKPYQSKARWLSLGSLIYRRLAIV